MNFNNYLIVIIFLTIALVINTIHITYLSKKIKKIERKLEK